MGRFETQWLAAPSMRSGCLPTRSSRTGSSGWTTSNEVRQRGTCEQWIKEGKGPIKWARLSCRTFAANAVRLQLHALAYNLGNFLRTLATPGPIKDWSLTTLKDKLPKRLCIRGRNPASHRGQARQAREQHSASPFPLRCQ
jgi:Transposase DDE domain group 1